MSNAIADPCEAEIVEPLSPEWFAARREGIGASEIAAVMGISPWESPFSLYWRKVNGWEFPDAPELEWGRRLEPVIADRFAQDHPEWIVRAGGLEVHPFRPWQLATPDRKLFLPPDADRAASCDLPMSVLECKTAATSAGWGEPGSDDIPVYYRAQVLWQMNVVGVNTGHVAALIGGTDYREYLVRGGHRDINLMIEWGRRFMRRLETGDPPPLDDHSQTMVTLRRLHPDVVDERVVVDDDTAAGYARAVRARRLAERVERRYGARLLAAMAGARVAVTADGRKVTTRVVSDVAAETKLRGPVHRDYLLPASGGKKEGS
jgi:putative phage-type endonuclease